MEPPSANLLYTAPLLLTIMRGRPLHEVNVSWRLAEIASDWTHISRSDQKAPHGSVL